MAIEGRLTGDIEVIGRVERAVAAEVVRVAVHFVGPRPGDAVDDPAGRASVFGGVVAGKHREFRHRVDAEVQPQDTPRSAVRIVVDVDAIEPIVVLLRTPSRDSHLRAEAALPAFAAEPHLAANRGHSRFQRRQLRPVASVQRKISNRPLPDDPAQGRRCGVDQHRSPRHHHLFAHGPEIHPQVHRHLRTDRDGDPAGNFFGESRQGRGDSVRAGHEVRD